MATSTIDNPSPSPDSPASRRPDEKRELLARLLDRLAHEIRNPLSSMDIHFQLLEEDLEDLQPALRDAVSARLQTIRGELNRLEAIVKQYLRLAGPSAPDPEPVDVSALASHACALLRPEAERRGATIAEVPAVALPRVNADPGQVTQVLINLVINAIQAADNHGRIEVRVRAAGDEIAVEVADSGPGVPESQREAIFEPYYSDKSDGNGLGLWIAQQIAVAHRGSLDITDDAALGGALFTLRLPVEGVSGGAAE